MFGNGARRLHEYAKSAISNLSASSRVASLVAHHVLLAIDRKWSRRQLPIVIQVGRCL